MTVWFASDPHIGHNMVARLRYEELAGYKLADTNVILPDIADWHDNLLAENWDAVVRNDDVVWVLGDISAGGSHAQLRALAWLDKRPGQKHLISGNHDGCHPTHRDAHKWLGHYKPSFASIASAATRKIALPDGSSQRVLLSHFPYGGDHTFGDRYTQWRLADEGLTVLHGHTHSGEKVTYTNRHSSNGALIIPTLTPTKQIHVGLDAWELHPVSLEQIAELL